MSGRWASLLAMMLNLLLRRASPRSARATSAAISWRQEVLLCASMPGFDHMLRRQTNMGAARIIRGTAAPARSLGSSVSETSCDVCFGYRSECLLVARGNGDLAW